MFKQLKKSTQIQKQCEQSLQHGNLSRTQKISHQHLPKQLIQFLARQMTVLKDISSSCHQAHPDIVTNRLQQCIHLIEKKILFSLGDNPELYHDYIQDFYENQLGEVRSELNGCKMELMLKKKQLQELKTANDILLREKDTYIQSIQSSRILKNGNQGYQKFQENSKFKKELDHCRLLLIQNNNLIQEQAKAIQSLSMQLKGKQKQLKNLRQTYDKKIIKLDDQLNNKFSQIDQLAKNLSVEHKNYQSQLKQISLTKIRVLEQKRSLQKELEMKIQEIQLLTKKVLQDQIFISKMERTIVMKDKLIEELYQQIDSVNGSLSRIGKKQQVFHKTYVQKNEEIGKLEQRIRLANETNEKIEKKNLTLTKKIQELHDQIALISQHNSEFENRINKLELENQSCLRKLQISEKNSNKLQKQKQRFEKQCRAWQQKYQELYEKNREQKQTVKKQILAEVNQLISLVQQRQKQLKLSKNQKEQLSKQLSREKQGRSEVEKKFEKMNYLMMEIQKKIDILQNQNTTLNEAKNILQLQLDKLNNQLLQSRNIKIQCEKMRSEKKSLLQELQKIRKQSTDVIDFEKTEKQLAHKKQNELQQQLIEQRKQHKQFMNKKDFQIKQLQSKVKILQEQIRDTSKIFENQKSKMGLKIKELEQLLKERYDFSSRFSQHSEAGC